MWCSAAVLSLKYRHAEPGPVRGETRTTNSLHTAQATCTFKSRRLSSAGGRVALILDRMTRTETARQSLFRSQSPKWRSPRLSKMRSRSSSISAYYATVDRTGCGITNEQTKISFAPGPGRHEELVDRHVVYI